MPHVLVIGDVHGKIGGYFDLIRDFTETYSRAEDVYSLQIGDFGFADTYKQKRKRIERSYLLDDNHYFFGGNHDDYDHYEEAHGSLGHFGEVPFIEDSFFVRGAKSIDKEQRTMGQDWWKEEELNWKQSRNAIERYIELEPRHVFTHEAPMTVSEKMFPSKKVFSSNTGQLLSEMFANHKPETWTFGHWHTSKTFDYKTTSFRCLGELETAEFNI